MPRKAELKTSRENASLTVTQYLNGIEPDSARRDAKALAKLFKAATGAKPAMWGSSIVGFGEYAYTRANGDHASFMAAGFSIRKTGPVLYIMPGYQDYSAILKKLGPHKTGKSCLYLKSLEAIDMDVLAGLIKRGIADLKKAYTVKI
jgi:hypothetical protein